MSDKATGAQSSKSAETPAKKAAPKPEPEASKEEPLRAAGYINRDDGEGWVLEEEEP